MGFLRLYGSPGVGSRSAGSHEGGQGCQELLFCQRHLFAGALILLSPGAHCGGAQGTKKGLFFMLRLVQWLNCLLGRNCWKNKQLFKARVSGKRAEV